MNGFKNSAAFFDKIVTRIEGYKTEILIATMKRKKLNVTDYCFDSNYYNVKKILNESSVKKIEMMLFWDFSQLGVSFEKKLFVLKLVLLNKISIMEICTGVELFDDNGRINIECVVHFLNTSSFDDGKKIMKVVRSFVRNAA